MTHLAPQEAAVVKGPEQQAQGQKGQNQQSPEPRSALRQENLGPLFSHLAKVSLFTINPTPPGIGRQTRCFSGDYPASKRLIGKKPANFSISQPKPNGRTRFIIPPRMPGFDPLVQILTISVDQHGQ